MNRYVSVIPLMGSLVLAAAGTAFASSPGNSDVIVSGGHYRGQSLDGMAIDACAKTMISRMFPGTRKQIQVRAGTGDQVFGDAIDDAMLGFQMAVLLKATDADTGETLGTAECDVTPNAQVVALLPGVKELPPGT